MRTDKPRILWRLIAVLLAFSLIAAACGSDDDDDAATSATTEPADEPAEEVSDDPLVVAAMSAAGDMVELPQITAGYLQWINAEYQELDKFARALVDCVLSGTVCDFIILKV